MTLGFGLAVALVFVAVMSLVVIGFVIARLVADPNSNTSAYADSLPGNGVFLWISTFLTSLVCSVLVIAFAYARRGTSVRSYLALQAASLRGVLAFLGLTAVVLALGDVASFLLHQPLVPRTNLESYATAGQPVFLWVAVAVAAPIFEEIFFRGFLFQGLAGSRLGPRGAILVTSVLWTLTHYSYGCYYLPHIFILGILLGAARWRTGSTYTAIAMHMLANLVALTEMAVYAQK